jgi:hypothetical protein
MNVRLDHPMPIEIDPRPCELCGLKIDRHEMVDGGEGPIFFCAEIDPENLSLPELERRAELRRQEEVAAILARLEAADDPSKRLPLAPRAEPYRTPQSTEHAFLYLVSLKDPDRLVAWLHERERDRPFLLKLLEAK